MVIFGRKTIPLRGVYEVWTTPWNLDPKSQHVLLRRRKLIYMFDRMGFFALLLPFHTSYGLWSERMTIAQVKAYENPEVRGKIGREIVSAIIHNIVAVFHRYIRKRLDGEIVEEFKRRMKGVRECLSSQKNIILIWLSLNFNSVVSIFFSPCKSFLNVLFTIYPYAN